MNAPVRIDIALTPVESGDLGLIRQRALKRAKLRDLPNFNVQILSQSIDARKSPPLVRMQVQIHDGPIPEVGKVMAGFQPVSRDSAKRVVVIGAGPAGYFAALELLTLGLVPVVLERGKDAKERRYDLRAIMQQGEVNPHSNYCFGEGGAGTYSDGKLYTRSDKRGDIHKILRLLVDHGARSDILTQAHPHIGSNKLPGVIENMRQTILDLGGEVHFGEWVTDLEIEAGQLRAVVSSKVDAPEKITHWPAAAAILATGHSARDVFDLLERKGLELQEKTFALGVRVEHPQALIDQAQYRQCPRDPHLPAASYRLVGDGVWSFCMCPGGLIVPAATAPGEIVVNGMSMSGRNSRWANSGIVVEVREEDLAPYSSHGVQRGVFLQRAIEQKAFAVGTSVGGKNSQSAPAQRVADFLAGNISSDLPRSSYYPGLHSHPLHEMLPERMVAVLRQGFQDFGRKIRGYLSEDAVLVGVESRTSSPVRVPRDPEGLFHPQCTNLFPSGEGAGYAGGIVSAAVDGQRVAQAAARVLSI